MWCHRVFPVLQSFHPRDISVPTPMRSRHRIGFASAAFRRRLQFEGGLIAILCSVEATLQGASATSARRHCGPLHCDNHISIGDSISSERGKPLRFPACTAWRKSLCRPCFDTMSSFFITLDFPENGTVRN